MNAVTEKVIEQLIRKHGRDTVVAAWSELIAHANWPDWQRVNSCIKNTANRIERQTKV